MFSYLCWLQFCPGKLLAEIYLPTTSLLERGCEATKPGVPTSTVKPIANKHISSKLINRVLFVFVSSSFRRLDWRR